MRTTITLDEDVAALIESERARTGESFELSAGNGRQALELFYHPFAYASRGTHSPPAELANPVG